MSQLNEHRADWPARRVKHYGPLSVGQTVFYSRSKSHHRQPVAGDFEIVSLGPCESGVIVDMTYSGNHVRCHVCVSANGLGHCHVDLCETFRVVKAAPIQAEMRI